MIRFDIISAAPKLLGDLTGYSILSRAVDKGLATIEVHDLRDHTPYARRQIDDYQYGGGAGMVLMAEPLIRCVEHLQEQRSYDEIIYMSPDGEIWEQSAANSMSLGQNFILICGHYKGIDERVREHYITKDISLGDFVLSGGEIAAAAVVDSVVRLIPGVIGDETSALSDSFQDGLLSAPIYTRPEEVRGWRVPEVLLGGNHAEIEKWRYKKSLEKTEKRRPDLLKNLEDK